MTRLAARSNSSREPSAPTSRAISMKRLDCAGSSRGGLGLRGINLSEAPLVEPLDSSPIKRLGGRQEATMAGQAKVSHSLTFFKERLLNNLSRSSVAKAMCTNPMRWFASADLWLQHISEGIIP